MLRWLGVPIGWGELFKRTFREALKDDCLGLAAQLAYYFFLALFPAVLFLLALASFFPLQNLNDDLLRVLGPIASPDIVALLEGQLARLARADSGGVLTVGVLGALWSSSAALVAIVESLNRAYDVVDGRPWWKVRLVAIVLTVVLALFVLVSFTLVLVGPTLAERVADWFGLGPAFEWTWKILQWPLACLLISGAVAVVYYLAPDVEQRWIWVAPGALLATLAWLAISLGFKFYVTRLTDYNAAYGALGGVIALMLWFYLSGLAILIGAELNAEIEHASPHGKAPGEKAPRRLSIGFRSGRAVSTRSDASPDSH